MKMGWTKRVRSLSCHQVAFIFGVVELAYLLCIRIYLCFYDGTKLNSVTTITIGDEKRDVIADLNSERDVRGDVLQALVTITLLLAIFKKIWWLHLPWLVHAVIQVGFTFVVNLMFIIWLYGWTSASESKELVTAILAVYALFAIAFKICATISVYLSLKKLRNEVILNVIPLGEKKTPLCLSSAVTC